MQAHIDDLSHKVADMEFLRREVARFRTLNGRLDAEAGRLLSENVHLQYTAEEAVAVLSKAESFLDKQ